MRTTVDLPGPVFRRLKAAAVLQGISLKDLILRAVEKELAAPRPKKGRIRFPLRRSKEPGTLSLTNAQIDEFLWG